MPAAAAAAFAPVVPMLPYSGGKEKLRPTITLEMVEKFIREHPGCTQKEIAEALPNGDKIYGAHKFVAARVAALRKAGKLADVNRCPCCSQATTRGRQNARLTLLS